MKHVLTALIAAALSACAHAPPPAKSVLALHEAADWGNEDGATLAAAMDRSVQAIARAEGRDAILAQLKEAGYECTFGEAHEDYPEPAAVCKRSFATRACQFDWDVTLTSSPAKPGKVAEADTGFTRDCVGLGRDWPVPVKSAIDDQLAPAPDLPQVGKPE